MRLEVVTSFANYCREHNVVKHCRDRLQDIDVNQVDVREEVRQLSELLSQVVNDIVTLLRLEGSTQVDKSEELSRVSSQVERNLFRASCYIDYLAGQQELEGLSEQDLDCLYSPDHNEEAGLYGLFMFLDILTKDRLIGGFEPGKERGKRIEVFEDLVSLAFELGQLAYDTNPNLPFELKCVYHHLQKAAGALIAFFDALEQGLVSKADSLLAFACRSLALLDEPLKEMYLASSVQDDDFFDFGYELATRYATPLAELLQITMVDSYPRSKTIGDRMMEADMSHLDRLLDYGREYGLDICVTDSNGALLGPDQEDELRECSGFDLREHEPGLAEELKNYIVHELYPGLCRFLSLDLSFIVSPESWEAVVERGLTPNEVNLSPEAIAVLFDTIGEDCFDVVQDALTELVRLYFNHHIVPEITSNQYAQQLASGFELSFHLNIDDHVERTKSQIDNLPRKEPHLNSRSGMLESDDSQPNFSLN